MLKPWDVTACLVTRGDQPEMVEKIRESLIFERVLIWDNSREADWKCAGRYMAALRAKTEWVYFQDDDVIVPKKTQAALVYEVDFDDVCVANWGHGETPDGYDDLPLVCGGAIVKSREAIGAMLRYAEHFPLDDDFKYEADFVVGTLYPSFRHVNLPFEIDLEIAQSEERLCNQPWQKDLKYEITQRARSLRAMVPA